ncbi:hypothetical protein D3Z36_10410 [Lachnospiraceae bacterium]|nr:hypothetical protein [Lachnospiraceae bacterium]
MEFEAIILEHMGKDIYIGIEVPKEHRRQEAVFQNYRVLSPQGREYRGSGAAIVCSLETRKEVLHLELKARIERKACLFDMIDIEARYKKYFYHIYITNCINVSNSRRFVRQQK